MCVLGAGREGEEDRALCALRPASGFHFPTGPLEEVDLQVLPDVESDTEMLEAVGDGQACVTVSICVRGLVGAVGVVGLGWGDWLLCPCVCVCVCVLVTQSCLTICNPMDCSPLGSSVHEILQAKMLE